VAVALEPLRTSARNENDPAASTLCFLPVRKCLIQFRSFPDIPYPVSLVTSAWHSTYQLISSFFRAARVPIATARTTKGVTVTLLNRTVTEEHRVRTAGTDNV